VNFWSFLEYEKGWKPVWYAANHDESILNVCPDVCCRTLITDVDSVKYEYPPMEPYVPSSTSYITVWDPIAQKDVHVLNTRFVNYTIYNNGVYNIADPNRHIKTRNLCAVLDTVRQIPRAEDWTEMADLSTDSGLVSYGGSIYGLEDIRLFLPDERDQTQIHFVASNMNYQPNHQIRILEGVYDITQKVCRNVRVLNPPMDTYCEKNWVPIGNAHYIYKWWPFEIGVLDETNKVNLVLSMRHNTPYFQGVRGSSTFVNSQKYGGWLGVVHFSVEKWPRHYYHMMVLLDKTTFLPLKYSNFFCFRNKSIEFCTGFAIDDSAEQYIFWISNFDKDAECIIMNQDRILLHHSFSFFT